MFKVLSQNVFNTDFFFCTLVITFSSLKSPEGKLKEMTSPVERSTVSDPKSLTQVQNTPTTVSSITTYLP